MRCSFCTFNVELYFNFNSILHTLDEGFSLNCTTMYFTGPVWLLGGIYSAVKVCLYFAIKLIGLDWTVISL